MDNYRDGVLQHECFFSYDRRVNYQRGQPHRVGRLSYCSADNVVESGYADYHTPHSPLCVGAGRLP